MLLSKDFPVNEYLILTSLIRLPLLSYASAFKFTTSPVLTFSGFCKLRLILATGFFSIFIVLDDLIPSKTTVIVADPDSKAKTLLDSSIFNLSLDELIENSKLEKYLSALIILLDKVIEKIQKYIKV